MISYKSGVFFSFEDCYNTIVSIFMCSLNFQVTKLQNIWAKGKKKNKSQWKRADIQILIQDAFMCFMSPRGHIAVMYIQLWTCVTPWHWRHTSILLLWVKGATLYMLLSAEKNVHIFYNWEWAVPYLTVLEWTPLKVIHSQILNRIAAYVCMTDTLKRHLCYPGENWIYVFASLTFTTYIEEQSHNWIYAHL